MTPEPDQGDACVAQRTGGQEALDDQVVGPVRGRGEQRAADKAAEQGVGPVKSMRGSMTFSLPG